MAITNDKVVKRLITVTMSTFITTYIRSSEGDQVEISDGNIKCKTQKFMIIHTETTKSIVTKCVSEINSGSCPNGIWLASVNLARYPFFVERIYIPV